MGHFKSGLWVSLLVLGTWSSVAMASDNAGATETPTIERPTVGLVLGGGGARGAAHVGVIKVLDELRVPVDYIAGTSMGAIVGGLYASGMSVEELEKVIEQADWSTLLTDRPPRALRPIRRKSDDIGFLVDFDLGVDKDGLILPQGFVQGQNLEIALKRLTLPVISAGHFDALPIPFRAVATNITTGEAAILDSGNLATAMRASMSAPGVFKPVHLDGRILVDGGIANNLPVQVVRNMGADILIVVDVGFPLLPESELNSAVAVTLQMLTVLINARAREQLALLAQHDILISPELGDMSSQAFNRLEEAGQLGENKARKLAPRLASLSVSPEAYSAYRNDLQHRRRSLPVVEKIVVENESKLSTKVISTRLMQKTGKTLDPDQLEANIADVYGFNTFETVSYDIRDDADGTTLVVRGQERSWGPNYLRFGLNIEDDLAGNSSYNLAARLTRTEFNDKGGELRAEIQIGESPGVFAELYQPLDYASRWFINPQIRFSRARARIFGDGVQLAELRSNEAAMALEGGRQFGNWAEFRVGVTRIHSDTAIRIGLPDAPDSSSDTTLFSAGFGTDTIDRVAVPRSGTNIAINWIGSREALGSDSEFDLVQTFLLKPQTWGDHTLLHWWNLSATTKDKTAGVTPLSLGGLFSLSGYSAGELFGKHSGIGRLLYYRRVGDKPLPGLDTSIFVGASLEAGNVWQTGSDISLGNTLVAGSAFVVFDTLVGPLYIAYGAAEGGRRSAYLFLGQTF